MKILKFVKKVNSLVHCVEQVLHARNSNLISPFAFRRNLLVYAETRSKLACQIADAWEPAGGYTTISSFLMQPREPASIPDGNVNITIDNNQKIARSSGRICEGSSVPVSICTSVSYITSDVRDDDDDALPIMEEPFMSPGQWLHPPDDAVMAVVDAQEELHLHHFRRKRDIYIDEVLNEVCCQQQVRENLQIFDYVDLAVLHDETKLHVCSQCLYVSKDISSGVCPNCKMSFVSHCPDYDPYKSANGCHYGKSTVTIGNPVMVNPCSMDSVATVVNDIFSRFPDNLAWATLWSDGVPYLYGCKGQDQEDDIFSKFLFRPGPGHIELNMARLLLEFLWDPVCKDVAKRLGFKTPRALDVVKRGVDHHRSRQILGIVFEALWHELVVLFVRASIAEETVPSSEIRTKQVILVGFQEFVILLQNIFTFFGVLNKPRQHLLSALEINSLGSLSKADNCLFHMFK